MPPSLPSTSAQGWAIFVMGCLVSADSPAVFSESDLTIYDSVVFGSSSVINQSTVVEQLEQAWEAALRPEVYDAQIAVLLDIPLFHSTTNPTSSETWAWEGLPKNLILTGNSPGSIAPQTTTLTPISVPITLNDSIVIIAGSHGRRNKIMNDVKQAWENATAGNLSGVQLDILIDQVFDTSSNPEGFPVRSITYRITGTSLPNFSEFKAKRSFRQFFTITNRTDIWLIPEPTTQDTPVGLPAPSEPQSPPKPQTVTTQAAGPLRLLFFRVHGETSRPVNMSIMKYRFRKVIAAFPIQGVYFVPNSDAATDAFDLSVQQQSRVVRNVTKPESAVIVQNCTSFEQYRPSFEVDQENATSSITMLNVSKVLAGQHVISADNEVEIDYTPVGRALHVEMLSQLIHTMEKLTEISNQFFKRAFH